MADVEVRLDAAACRQVLNSQEVQQALLERAERIREQADGMYSGRYEADVQPGRNRAHAMVKTPYGDYRTVASQAKHNTLLKAMSAGRDQQ